MLYFASSTSGAICSSTVLMATSYAMLLNYSTIKITCHGCFLCQNVLQLTFGRPVDVLPFLL